MSQGFFYRTQGTMPSGKHSPEVRILTAEEISRREADGQMKYRECLRQRLARETRGANRRRERETIAS